MKQGLSINQLASEILSQKKLDTVLPSNQLAVDIGQERQFCTINGFQTSMTQHAMNQVATDMGIPTSYVRKLRESNNIDLLNDNFNTLLERSDKARLFRTTDTHGLRGYLSNSYSTDYDNIVILESIMPVLQEMGDDIEIKSCALTDTRMYLKVTSKRLEGEVTRGDVVAGGISIVNSEVGMSFYAENEFIERLVCTNGMVRPHNLSTFRKMHRGSRMDFGTVPTDTSYAVKQAIALQIRDSVRQALSPDRFQQTLGMMQNTTERKINGKLPEVIKTLGKTVGFTQDEGDGILNYLAEGGDLSQWGLLNAVTRYSQDVESYDRATQLEVIGGKILELTPHQWRNVSEAA